MKRLVKLQSLLVIVVLLVLVSTASAASRTFTGTVAVEEKDTYTVPGIEAGTTVTVVCHDDGDGSPSYTNHSHLTVIGPLSEYLVSNECCGPDRTYTFVAPSTGTYTFNVMGWSGEVDYSLTVSYSGGQSEPEEVEEVIVPGCDTALPLNAKSVVGMFVTDTKLYWGPDMNTPTSVDVPVIPAGKTAWVLGKDASGEFYRVVWQCQKLWAPVASMGPNSDAVWHSHPLPTDVVE
jgi:hypothetical protein